RRRHGPEHPDPQCRGGGRHPALPHRRRHRDRLRSAARAGGNPRQGTRHAAGAGGRVMNAMASASFVGLARVDGVSVANRGLAYGDGVFETMRVHDGELPLWPGHLARLREGAQRLGIGLPDPAFIEACIDEMIDGADAGVIKLLLTRGDGGRGYAPPVDAQPAWTLALYPLPPITSGGLCLHACDTRLAIQPALAGIKHCNRLEQVLARAEAERAGCDEG